MLRGVIMSEIRNELLGILSLVKDDDKDFRISMLLDRFETDIKSQLEDLEYKKRQLEDNLKTLDYVKEVNYEF